MKNINFKESVQNRRSYYNLSSESPISDKDIQDIIEHITRYAPSAFNSQSARIVLLLRENHQKLWEITKDELKKISKSEEDYKKTEDKINTSFLSGYGTILFFEDEEVVSNLQKKFPLYKEKFTQWSEHSSAIHQVLIWIALKNEGLGASLQHYNPIIDEPIKKQWNLNTNWKLIAQMPFGKPLQEPKEKEHEPISERFLVFK